ncbi:acyltransferase [Hymenobacter sp. BT770]|uniref:acyltransferase family protein n=1 Tax=Hymenobacter sp. BT770 TaxID=2886942 RepID=UPI001D10C460|nr:acyltransferase [Hymenobacter sp. BT770]MCC3153187.1 acyltransferase [Hymenobacter sp. BT770]MDO3415339.1 acyltransferase [Hymenobacter sp. BT770]
MKTYYPALTGVRAVAAYMVVMVHMSALETPAQLPYFKMLAVEYIRQWGIGVVIFFVLSGFLITTRYADRVEPTRAWATRYLQNRFARIYPIYFLLTALAFAVMVLRPTHGWWEWSAAFTLPEKLCAVLLNLTLLRGYFNQYAVLGLPTAWSLTVEETFYLMAPFLLLGLRRNFRRVVVYPVALLALGFLLVAFCSHFLPYYGLMKDAKFMLNMTFFGHSVEFVLGMALALWVARQPRPTGRGIAYTVLGAGGILLYMLVQALLYHFFPGHYYPITEEPDWSYRLLFANNVGLPVLVCSLFWGLISEQTLLRRLLETRLFQLLGKASYVLYLIHLGTFDYLFRKYVSGSSLICLVAYTLVSIALYRLVERPLHQRLRAKPHPQAVAA